MAVEMEIDVDNNKVKLSNMATEETLKKLIQAIENLSPGAGNSGPVKGAAKAAQQNVNKPEKVVLELQGFRKTVDEVADELGISFKKTREELSLFDAAIKDVTDITSSIIRFGHNTENTGLSLKSLDAGIEKLAKNLPTKFGKLAAEVIGAASHAIIGHTGNLLDAFDKLSRTGAVFSGNLYDIGRAAANAYIPLEKFTEILTNNSGNFTVFGGSVRTGTQRFVAISKEMANYRIQLKNLGIKELERGEILADLIAIEQRNHNFQTMSTNQQALAAVNFAYQLNALAAITGEDRKQIAKRLADRRKEAAIELRLTEIRQNASTEARVIIDSIEQMFSNVDGISDLISAGAKKLTPATDDGRNLLISPLGKAIHAITGQALDGAITFEQSLERISDASKDHANSFSQSFFDLEDYSKPAKQMAEFALAGKDIYQLRNEIETKYNNKFGEYVRDRVTLLDEETKTIKAAEAKIQEAERLIRIGFNASVEFATGKVIDASEKISTFAERFYNSSDTFEIGINKSKNAVDRFSEALDRASGKVLEPRDDTNKVWTEKLVDNIIEGVAHQYTRTMDYIRESIGGSESGHDPSEHIIEHVIDGSSLTKIGSTRDTNLVADSFGFEYGGIIRKPTLSMIGEGSSDEAVIPLKNNRTVPVDIDLKPIEDLSKNVERLIDMQNKKMDNKDVIAELKKLNKQTDRIVKLNS